MARPDFSFMQQLLAILNSRRATDATPEDMYQAKSLMRQNWRDMENQTLEQQRNMQRDGAGPMWGGVPYRDGGTLGDIWDEQAMQRELMQRRYMQILNLIGRPQ